MKRQLFALALLLVALGCGKRGDPKPPVPVIPQATGDLAVAQRGDRVVLTWAYPSLTTAGRSLASFRRITVYRYSEALPVAPGGQDPNALVPGDRDANVPQPVALFAKIPTLPKAQFVKLATKVDSIEKGNLASATAGAKLVFSDTPPFTSADGRPVRLTYAVVTEGESARSEYSNLAILVPLPVAVAPAGLTATANPHGVALAWTAPDKAVTGDGAPVITGYHVYRTAAGEEPNEFATPITATPVVGTSFDDTPPYGEHEYRVVAVASPGPPAVQSAFSAPVRATFKDLLPPPAPQNVTPLIEAKTIRLIWDPVDAPDLAGYLVYREEGVGHENPRSVGIVQFVQKPIKETTYVQPVDLGIAFRYSVTAVDTSGNESEKLWTNWVVAPKTPGE